LRRIYIDTKNWTKLYAIRVKFDHRSLNEALTEVLKDYDDRALWEHRPDLAEAQEIELRKTDALLLEVLKIAGDGLHKDPEAVDQVIRIAKLRGAILRGGA